MAAPHSVPGSGTRPSATTAHRPCDAPLVSWPAGAVVFVSVTLLTPAKHDSKQRGDGGLSGGSPMPSVKVRLWRSVQSRPAAAPAQQPTLWPRGHTTRGLLLTGKPACAIPAWWGESSPPLPALLEALPGCNA